MDKIKKLVASRQGNFVLVLVIFVLTFVTFNLLFEASPDGNYTREIIAALIGTILTAVITAVLLTQQSTCEELKERNVEVFRRKLEAYEQFVEISLDRLRDGLTIEEAEELRRSIYRIALISSANTVDATINVVRHALLRDSQIDFYEVIAEFRKELRLDPMGDEAFANLSAIERHLQGHLDDEQVAQTRATLEADFEMLITRLAEQGILADQELVDAVGMGDALSKVITMRSNATIIVHRDYDSEQSDHVYLVQVSTEDIEVRRRRGYCASLTSAGFEDDEDGSYSVLIDFSSTSSAAEYEELVLSLDEFVTAISAAERR